MLALVIFSVPFERDHKFIDRKDIFSKVEEQLSKRHRVSLHGIGGVGYSSASQQALIHADEAARKSQIAIEYAYRFQELHPESHVFWIYAASTTRFMQAYRDIAQEAKLPGCNDPKLDSCELVFKWLNGDDSGNWLMVVDNADNQGFFFPSDSSSDSSDITEAPSSKLLIDYIPQKLGPSRLLLFTTRNRALGVDLANGELSVEVPTLSLQEARDLLQSKLERELGMLDEPELEMLLDVLGYIPLAITQAAAFMNRNRQTTQKYLEAFEKDEDTRIDYMSDSLQDHRRERDSPNAVFRTWKLSFNQILKQEPPTAELLSLIVMLDPQRIPEELLRQSVEREVDFWKAIGTLNGFSLITQEIGGKTHTIHPLVRLSVHCWLEQRGQKMDYASQALQLLAENFPNGEHEHKEMCELLLAHAQAVLCHKCTSETDMRQRAALLHNVGWFDWQQGRYISAYQAALDSYDINRKGAGDIAIATLNSLDLLALVLQNQGKYEAAEEMNRRALEGYEKVLGVEHPDTLTSVSDLASVFQRQGKYEAAEEMNRRALEGYKKVLGAEHPSTSTSVSNLALVLQDQGKYKTAEEMSRRALEGREKVLGVEHPDTLTSVSDLASVFQRQGKYEAAEEMNRRALEGYKKVLGAEHPSTLTSVSNLALVLQDQGKYKTAEEMSRRALEGREKVLGVEHPDTLTSVSDLALVFQRQGKYEAAEEMSRRALEGSEKVLGVEHPSTLTSVSNLASVLQNQGKYEAAEEMSRQALEGKEKVLGVEHPRTLTSVSNLALVLRYQGKYEAAEEMSRRALEGSEKVLGVEHPGTLTSVSNLALVLRYQGKYEAAEEMSRRALKGKEKVLGVEHPRTLISVYILAYLLHRQQRYNEASVLYTRASEGFLKTLGQDHPTTLKCSNNHSSMIREMQTHPTA